MDFTPRLKAMISALVTSSELGGADVNRPVLYSVYGTDIIVRLARIHAHHDRDSANGVLVVALRGRRPAFVRCVFAENGAKLVCEAVPGRYPPKPGHSLPIPAETAAGLKEAGYWPDPISRRALFRYEIGANPDRDVWGGVSVTILNPLIAVFGARARSKIDIIAPLAPKRDEIAIEQELLGR